MEVRLPFVRVYEGVCQRDPLRKVCVKGFAMRMCSDGSEVSIDLRVFEQKH